ncbi:MAG: M20/M25/M40 family metallo-hydrolase [Clostridia bacterium]|nr:M20/M25/M40 family metallo-hydrolase [Clostridia bacterium]
MRISDYVDGFEKLITDTQAHIFANAETGYREWGTAKYLEDIFEDLGYTLTRAGDIPGFYTDVDTGKDGPTLLIMGELDSILCSTHPNATKTGAAHSCGHSAQCGALVGIVAALSKKEALEGLCGKIRLCAVPAEELIEIEYRKELKKQGIIKYMGGKPEFLRRGYFDGVDIAFMVHTTTNDKFIIQNGSIGCLAKRITYKGVSAHAGGSPWDGVNALYAANTGIAACNAVRETFRERDVIRFHPIITKGGGAVNAVPDEVIVESYVRGMTFDGILDANRKINRALIGGALALGANVEIEDIPGYAPLSNSKDMMLLAKDALDRLGGVEYVVRDVFSSGCTDMGDLSCIMPVVHPYAPGAVGKDHGNDYFIEDPHLACVMSAKWQLEMMYLLLENGGARARKIKEDFKPLFPSKEAYFEYIDGFERTGNRIEYLESEAKILL